MANLPDPDWTDPCAVLAWITPQYYKVAAGVATLRVRYGERETFYQMGNIAELSKLMATLQNQCAAKNGGTKRHAIRFG